MFPAAAPNSCLLPVLYKHVPGVPQHVLELLGAEQHVRDCPVEGVLFGGHVLSEIPPRLEDPVHVVTDAHVVAAADAAAAAAAATGAGDEGQEHRTLTGGSKMEDTLRIEGRKE
jgi:hypothetical protein